MVTEDNSQQIVDLLANMVLKYLDNNPHVENDSNEANQDNSEVA